MPFFLLLVAGASYVNVFDVGEEEVEAKLAAPVPAQGAEVGGGVSLPFLVFALLSLLLSFETKKELVAVVGMGADD